MTRGPIASQVRVKILLYVIIDIPIDALAGIVRELVRSNFIVSKGQWWNGGKIQCNNTECCSHEESQNCTGWKMTCRISCSIIFPWMEWGRMGGSFLAPSPCPFWRREWRWFSSSPQAPLLLSVTFQRWQRVAWQLLLHHECIPTGPVDLCVLS